MVLVEDFFWRTILDQGTLVPAGSGGLESEANGLAPSEDDQEIRIRHNTNEDSRQCIPR